MSRIAETIDEVCKLIREKVDVGFGIASPQATVLEQKISDLERALAELQLFPPDWEHKHSIGKGNLASVMWIVFLPPGQTTQDGIYVSFCFGKAGNGLVTGCAISNTSKDKYSYVPTVERNDPAIDVDGTRPGTHYNNGYVNPLEVFAGKVDEIQLKNHITESVEKCQECLNMMRPKQVESREGKKVAPMRLEKKARQGTRTLAKAIENDEMLKRLAAALRTKPFAILAGHSGTGKSQLVRRLAYMTCNNETLIKEGEGKTAPGNYCMVQVKPNWHDSTDLLGYYSEMNGRHFVNTPFVEFVCKAYAYPDTPFFVCLDEMNLAPVEQYFAEYLSAIESLEKKDGEWVTDPLVEVDKNGENVDLEILGQLMKGAESTEAAAWIQAHGLTIPKNLFVVGTVNMDETTCQFSRKVLDRAMTLLMNEVKFGEMSKSGKPSEEELLDDDGLKFFLEGETRGEVGETESGLLDAINEPLANTAFVVAYRFANEYALYEAAWAKLKGVDLATASEEEKKSLATEALDHVVLMKLLPRIHGERAAVKAIFEGAKKKDGSETPGLKTRLPAGGLSDKMMEAILARGDEYLTFWP